MSLHCRFKVKFLLNNKCSFLKVLFLHVCTTVYPFHLFRHYLAWAALILAEFRLRFDNTDKTPQCFLNLCSQDYISDKGFFSATKTKEKNNNNRWLKSQQIPTSWFLALISETFWDIFLRNRQEWKHNLLSHSMLKVQYNTQVIRSHPRNLHAQQVIKEYDSTVQNKVW